MRIHNDITEIFGNTPLVRLNSVTEGLGATVLAKLEFYNPSASVKDRLGVAIVDAAEKSGELRPGGTIVEGTSGNTGIALAMVGAARGYRVVLTMPDTMSKERRMLLRAYGAELVLTPGSEGMRGAVNAAADIVAKTPGAVLAKQFENAANPAIHRATTGPEVWNDTDGAVDIFVSGIGTGGTITGVGRYLKERNPLVKLVGVDPPGSIYTDPNDIHSYLVEGIGEDFWPTTFDFNIVDQWIQVDDRNSFVTANRLAREEAILAGGSCGTALYGALQVARELGEGKRVVCMMPDSGRGYLSKVYNPGWLVERGMIDLDEAKELTPSAALDLLAAAGVVL
ncbi:MAG: Cysteine synthase [Microbacteriaceae bacterium]|nr:Cysteine synthase [Microbacteriaceae bacterium]